MANFKKAVKKTLSHEGTFSNHKYDSGGKTMYGITENVARNYGYKKDMKDLPIKTAKGIYKKLYWDKIKLDNLKSQKVAEELFDSAVNCGVSRVVKWLQEDVNVLNKMEKLWDDIGVDGKFGNRSLLAVNLCLNYSKMEKRLLKLLNSDQTQHYKNLCQRKETQEIFMGGWLDKRVSFPVFRKSYKKSKK